MREIEIKEEIRINENTILEIGDKIQVLKERREERTGRFILVDGENTETWAVLEIDSTHFYLSRYTLKMPRAEEIKDKGIVNIHNIDQIRGKGSGDGLYRAIKSWLHGGEPLNNQVFTVS